MISRGNGLGRTFGGRVCVGAPHSNSGRPGHSLLAVIASRRLRLLRAATLLREASRNEFLGNVLSRFPLFRVAEPFHAELERAVRRHEMFEWIIFNGSRSLGIPLDVVTGRCKILLVARTSLRVIWW